MKKNNRNNCIILGSCFQFLCRKFSQFFLYSFCVLMLISVVIRVYLNKKKLFYAAVSFFHVRHQKMTTFWKDLKIYFKMRYYCIWSGWGGVIFPHSCPPSAVLCIGRKKDVGNTSVCWLLLISAHTASSLSHQHSPTSPSRLGVRESWEGT